MQVSDEEMTAALVAVHCLLHEAAEPEAADHPARPANWHAAAMLDTQGLVSGRSAATATWASADRAGREGRWSPGIV